MSDTEDRPTLVLSITVCTEDQSVAAKVSEVFHRTATGLALDGISVAVTLGNVTDEEEENGGIST